MKTALITGINGQDGSYLAELLLAKGYCVHGTVRRSSVESTTKMNNLLSFSERITIHTCTLDDHLSVYKLLSVVKPDECYHLAASSFVSYLFEDEASVIATNFNSTHFLLSSIKELVPNCHFYFAGSSEMFGSPDETPQNELSRFKPRSIYGISKLASYYVVNNYREQHGLYACTGLTYNHESTRRGNKFVSRKITLGVAKIFLKKINKIELGNIDAIRDWGYAPDYVQAMWQMLNNPLGPRDYVIATGKPHCVRDILETAFVTVGLDYQKHITINPDFFRSTESVSLIGQAEAIKRELGWVPKMKFENMIAEMVHHDINMLK